MKEKLDKKIYISYAWNDKLKEEKMFNQILETILNGFKNRGYDVMIDREQIKFKDSLSGFMQNLGKGHFIVMLISDKYLKSKNCLFEVIEILKNGNLHNRIFPIILNDAKIFDGVSIADYLTYWENKITVLNDKVKTMDNIAYSKAIIEEITLFSEIRRIISDFAAQLSNMQVLKAEEHLNDNFKILFTAIDEQLERDNLSLLSSKPEDNINGDDKIKKAWETLKLDPTNDINELTNRYLNLVEQYRLISNNANGYKSEASNGNSVENVEAAYNFLLKAINVDLQKAKTLQNEYRKKFTLKNDFLFAHSNQKNKKLKLFFTKKIIGSAIIVIFILSLIAILHFEFGTSPPMEVKNAKIIKTSIDSTNTVKTSNKMRDNPDSIEYSKIIKDAENLVLQGEEHFVEVLVLYNKALKLQKNEKLKIKIHALEAKINERFNTYIRRADNFIIADKSSNFAKENLEKARKLKPNDSSVIRKLEQYKNKK